MPHKLNLPADSRTECCVLLKRDQALVEQRIRNVKDAQAVFGQLWGEGFSAKYAAWHTILGTFESVAPLPLTVYREATVRPIHEATR